MAKNNNLTDFTTDIANALRVKKNIVGLINPQNFSSEIASIETVEDYTDIDAALNELDDVINGTYQTESIIAYATAQSGITYTTVSDLSSYTDEQIDAISKAISNCADITSSTQTVYLSNSTSISIGATRSYTLSTQESMTDRILGFNHDTLTSSTAYGEATASGKAGMTWQMVNCLATRYPMSDSSSNAGGWNSSKMKVSTIPTLLALLPNELQGVVKTVEKKSANGGSSNYSATVTTSENLFLLAGVEIFGSSDSYGYAQDGANEGTQYAY